MKEKIKVLLLAMLVMMFAVCMVSCGGSDSETASDEGAQTEESVEDEETASDKVAAAIDPDFKEAMDSYEAFFDEYVEFMEKYSESDNTMEMLEDYMEYMEKYQEAMEGLEQIEESDMNDAELAYYTEVSLRINKKLTEAASTM